MFKTMNTVYLYLGKFLKFFSYVSLILVLLLGIFVYQRLRHGSRPPVQIAREQLALSVESAETEFYDWWTDRPAVFKITDRVIVAIPPQFQEFWYQRDLVDRMPIKLENLDQIKGEIRFNMFLPDFHGFTPENYRTTFHQDKVDIYLMFPYPNEGEPGAPGYHTPNVMQRMTETPYSSIDQYRFEDVHGLRCFAKQHNLMDQYCLGQRRSDPDEWLLLDTIPKPYPVPNPLMTAHYYSSQFGGLRVRWMAHMKHFPRWKDIDQQIWKNLEAWNIAP